MNLDELKKNGFKIVTNWQECNKKSIFLFNSTDNKKFSIYKKLASRKKCKFIICNIKFKKKTNQKTFSYFYFKNKKDFQKPGYEIHQSVERKVEGNTACLGYSTKELEQMSPKEFNNLYHPESINDGFKIIRLLSGTTNSNSTISLDGVSILKSKNQKWITFNCKMLWERDFKNPNNWISNTYYTELEPIN